MKIIKIFIISSLLFGNLTCGYTQISMFLTKKKGTNINSITGIISNSKNKPISSLWVIVKKNDAIIGKSLTGDDGKYSVEKLNLGKYLICITKDPEMKKIIMTKEIDLIEKNSTFNFILPPDKKKFLFFNKD